MLNFKSLTPERKAYIKEVENITRFETHCIFRGIKPDWEMREKVKTGCVEWYRANPDKSFVPPSALMSFVGEVVVQLEESVDGTLEVVPESNLAPIEGIPF